MEDLHRFKVLLLPLCAACLALSLWMLLHFWAGAPMAGCGTLSGCDSVMSSPWAYVLGGVPVSLPAAAIYVLLLICLLFLGSDTSLDRMLWGVALPLLSGCIVGAALWFCWLQLGVLHRFCPYCTVLHLLGCVVAVLILRRSFRIGRHAVPVFVAGLFAAAIFAFVQARTVPETIYDSGSTGEALPVFTDAEVPALGVEDAPVEITLLFDFQCVHCRRLHRLLPELLDKTGGRLRIRLCPVPLSSTCNPYIPASGTDRFAGSCALTRLALAIWYAAPQAAPAYWDTLLDENAPDPEQAEAQARALLGEAFESALSDARIDAYLKRVYELFGRTSTLDKSGVPRLIYGGRWLVPEVDEADALLSLIRSELGADL